MAESVGNLVIKVRYRGTSGVKIKSFPLEGINSSHTIESVELVKSVYTEEVLKTLEYNKSKKPDLKLVDTRADVV